MNEHTDSLGEAFSDKVENFHVMLVLVAGVYVVITISISRIPVLRKPAALTSSSTATSLNTSCTAPAPTTSGSGPPSPSWESSWLLSSAVSFTGN